jgi:hypothetical protein
MPRGKKGTGPYSRKRLQRSLDYPTGSDAYAALHLTQEETRCVYTALRSLDVSIGTRAAAVAANVLYRLSEAVMSHLTVQEIVPTNGTRRKTKRAQR